MTLGAGVGSGETWNIIFKKKLTEFSEGLHDRCEQKN